MNEVRLIDANAVDVSQTVKGISDFAECIRDAVQTTLDNAPTVDAIEIPKNVTNGDMIKIMFPNIEIEGIGGDCNPNRIWNKLFCTRLVECTI